jgi:hypothetical protein
VNNGAAVRDVDIEAQKNRGKNKKMEICKLFSSSKKVCYLVSTGLMSFATDYVL